MLFMHPHMQSPLSSIIIIIYYHYSYVCTLCCFLGLLQSTCNGEFFEQKFDIYAVVIKKRNNIRNERNGLILN